MKLKGAKQVHYDSGPNMTPLVDVVMVILIFLMLAGSFGGTTQFLISKQGIHSKGAGSAKADPNRKLETPIDVRINNNPGGGFQAEGPGVQTNDPDKLRDALKGKLQQFLSVSGNTVDDTQVVLYPGKSVKYKDIIRVYQASLQAGYKKVAFATSH